MAERSDRGVGGFWRLVNAPLSIDPRAMRVGCGVFLVAYGLIAIARYEQSPGFFWSRLLICAYAAFGIRLARDVTWHRLRAYTVGAALLLPLQAAWVDGMLGNHVGEVAITAIATFCPITVLQAGIDVVVVVGALIAGHASVLAIVPPPAVPMVAILAMLCGAMATGTIAAFQSLLYRGRWRQSLERVEEALAASAEWENRYEAAIVASGQILYDWHAGTGEMQYRGACEAILGYAATELAGDAESWRTRMHADDVPRFEDEMQCVLAAKRPFRLSYRMRRKDGVYVIIENSGHFIVGDAGEIVRMIGFLSDVTERTEQSATSSALARVGRELISSVETPVVLKRLCRLTTEVLDCDFSTTWLWKPDPGVYAPIAGYGLDGEQWDAMRLIEIPSDPSTPLVARLLRHDLAQVTVDGTSFPLVAGMLAYYGLRAVLCVALRRGGKVVGIHSAGYRTREGGFTAMQERIARGIGQLGSMALTNAMLYEEVERAGRLKSEFVSTMSHELRTPLNVILGYTDMLVDGMASEEQRTLLGRVRASSLELLEMIDATLSLNRLATGTDQPRIEAFRLAALWDELRTEFDALPHAREVALRWQPVEDAVLASDRRRLKMIVKNLVGNARKFTATGEIVVACESSDATGVVLSVRDTGIGIPADQLPHIFEMFRQVDASDARSYGGVGLGLYIVRQLVEQLGGTIDVESRPGHGSTFRVRLPRARPPHATVAA